MKTTLLLLVILLTSTTQAAVWKSNKNWNASWQRKYANWIATSVSPRFFKKLGGPYKSLRLDCADAHYALLAYFSRKHGLNMVVGSGRTSNKTSSFDYIKNPEKRLAKFIAHLAGNYGTESIAHTDTYPVAVKSVRAGDLFIYKTGSNGNYTRHAYIIKNINLDGTFDIMYSTQIRRDKGWPLNRHPSYMFKKAPLNGGVDRNHWGFRRAKMPQHSSVSQESLGLSNFSQYSMARKYGRLGFFRQVRRANRSINESPNRIAQRNFETVCKSVKDRVESVQDGVNKSKKLGGRCMSFRDYDAYSTPSRDSGIKDDYRNYNFDVKSLSSSRLNSSNKTRYRLVFKDGLSGSQKSTLNNACSVPTAIGKINISSFRSSLFAGKVSFHPNDNIYRRWGIAKGSRTGCKQFYGYPSN